jgi:hypothetical protein
LAVGWAFGWFGVSVFFPATSVTPPSRHRV